MTLENILGFMDNSEASADFDEFSSKRIFGEDPYENSDKDTDDSNDEEGSTKELNNNQGTDTTEDTDTTTEDDNVDSPDDLSGDTDSNNNSGEDDKTNSEPTVYSEIFNILKENNSIYVDDDFNFDGSVESFEKALLASKENAQKAMFQAFWDKLPDVWKPSLQYALSGGEDVPTYLESVKQSKKLEDLDIKQSAEDQRWVLKEYYKATTRYPEDRIDKMVDKLYLLGDIEDEAQNALDELKTIEDQKRAALVEEQERKTQEAENQFREFKTNINSAIDSSPIIENEKKNKIKGFILNPVKQGDQVDTLFNTVLKNIGNSPEHLAQLAYILLDYDSKKGINLDRILKKESSNAVAGLRARLENLNSNNKTKVTGAGSKVSSKEINWEELLSQI